MIRARKDDSIAGSGTAVLGNTFSQQQQQQQQQKNRDEEPQTAARRTTYAPQKMTIARTISMSAQSPNLKSSNHTINSSNNIINSSSSINNANGATPNSNNLPAFVASAFATSSSTTQNLFQQVKQLQRRRARASQGKGSSNNNNIWTVQMPKRMLVSTLGVFLIFPLLIFLWKETHLTPSLDALKKQQQLRTGPVVVHSSKQDAFMTWVKDGLPAESNNNETAVEDEGSDSIEEVESIHSNLENGNETDIELVYGNIQDMIENSIQTERLDTKSSQSKIKADAKQAKNNTNATTGSNPRDAYKLRLQNLEELEDEHTGGGIVVVPPPLLLQADDNNKRSVASPTVNESFHERMHKHRSDAAREGLNPNLKTPLTLKSDKEVLDGMKSPDAKDSRRVPDDDTDTSH